MKPTVPKLNLCSTVDGSKSCLKFLLLCSIILNTHYDDLTLLHINTPDSEEIVKDKKPYDDCNIETDDSILTISWFEILQWIRLLFGRLRKGTSSSWQTFKSSCNEASTDAVLQMPCMPCQITVSKSPAMSSWKIQYHARCHSTSNDGDVHRLLVGEVDIVEDDGELYFDGMDSTEEGGIILLLMGVSLLFYTVLSCTFKSTSREASTDTICQITVSRAPTMNSWKAQCYSSSTDDGDSDRTLIGEVDIVEDDGELYFDGIDFTGEGGDDEILLLMNISLLKECTYESYKTSVDLLCYSPGGTIFFKFLEEVESCQDEHNEQCQLCAGMENGNEMDSIDCLLEHKGIVIDMDEDESMYIIQMQTVTVYFLRKPIFHLLELNPCLYRHGIKSHDLHQLLGRYITYCKLPEDNDGLHHSSFVDLNKHDVEREDELKRVQAINFHKCLDEYYVKLGMKACDAGKMRHILMKTLHSILTSSMNTRCSQDGGNMIINDPDTAPLAYIKLVGIIKYSKYDEQESKKSSHFCDIHNVPRVIYRELPEEKSTAPPNPDVRDATYASMLKTFGQKILPTPDGMAAPALTEGDVRSEQYRLSTFAHYPVSTHVSKINLAQAGFYFTGYSDRVKCFSCGRTVERWEASDNPSDATWHKSNCDMTTGFHSENVPMTSRFASAQVRNTHGCRGVQCDACILKHSTQNFPFQQRANPLPRDISDRSRPPIQQRNHGISSRPQTPRQWQMAQVMSSDHRRFLSNLFLNRELDRLSSFARWPTRRPNVPPSALAETGFFYLGDLDRTQCFSCGGVLRNWTANDNALSEHRDHFADCPMVLGAENRNVPIPEQPESREERERKFTCRYPSNPHMRSEATRLDTFDRRWPIGKTAATPEEIAQAGFFFLGERDRVKCWYCNGGLQNWDYDDAPWVEHAKWFPNCQFLLRAKGQHFVHRHLSAHPHLPRPIIAKQEGANLDVPATAQASPARQQNPPMPGTGPSSNQPAATLTIIDPREEKRKRLEHIQNVMKNSDIVKSVMLMGFDPKIVEGLLEDKLASGNEANNEDIYDSTSELLNDVMDRERQIKEESTQAKIPSGASHAAGAIGGADMPSTSWSAPRGIRYNNYFPDDDEDEAMEMYESTPATSTAVHGSALLGAMGSSVDVKDPASLQDAVTQMQEEGLCKICFSNQADMVFMPCGHMCCCMECTQAIRQCPICRKQIDKAIKTYRS